MRPLPLLAAALLLSVLAGGCGDDAETRAAAPSPAARPSISESPAVAPATLPVRLTGDGIDLPERVAVFGDEFDTVAPALTAALGEPTLDTREQQSFGAYGTCPGTRLRALEFGDGALRVLFGDVIGPGMTMYQWMLTGEGRAEAVPKASALVGDVTTYEFAVGDTLGALRAGAAGAELEVLPGDEMLEPSFRLTDQSAGFFGGLTGTSDDDEVTRVLAGEACGE